MFYPILRQTMVSVIIPAYNEESTIADIIITARHHPAVEEVIVVDDGSSDYTPFVAALAGATVIHLEKNSGKAAAMAEGVKKAKNDILCFLDADLLHFDREMITNIIAPVQSGECDMFIGIQGRKTFYLNKILHFFPIIGGERAIRRECWEYVPEKYRKNFQIEIAMNYFTKQNDKVMKFTVLEGFSQVIKEKKHGFRRGFTARLGMMWDIVEISTKLYFGESTKRIFREDITHLTHLFKKRYKTATPDQIKNPA